MSICCNPIVAKKFQTTTKNFSHLIWWLKFFNCLICSQESGDPIFQAMTKFLINDGNVLVIKSIVEVEPLSIGWL
jgi:hypothetical protein